MNHTTPVAAVPQATLHTAGPHRTPGAFCIAEDGSALLALCPCGCGDFRNLPLCQGTKQDRAWLWDGNRTAPTLTPSIRAVSGCHWHGHLNQGQWIPVGDSGK